MSLLHRVTPTRIIKAEAYDSKGFSTGSVIKPQFRVALWLDFKEKASSGEKVSVISLSVEAAKRFILLKTGKLPASKTVVTVVE